MKEYKIASIAGDGIKEVVPEAQKILKEVTININSNYNDEFDFHRIIMKNMEKCCLMIGRIKFVADAIFFGESWNARSIPRSCYIMITTSIEENDQFINLRPVKYLKVLMPH